MQATTIELESGHVSLVSHPKEIAELILLAAATRDRNETLGVLMPSIVVIETIDFISGSRTNSLALHMDPCVPGFSGVFI